MNLNDSRRSAIAHEVQELLPRVAVLYDAWRANTPQRASLSPATKRRLARRVVRDASPGFGIAEILLIVQAIAIALAIYERFFRDNPSFRAVANPDNYGEFTGQSLVASVVSEVMGEDS